MAAPPRGSLDHFGELRVLRRARARALLAAALPDVERRALLARVEVADLTPNSWKQNGTYVGLSGLWQPRQTFSSGARTISSAGISTRPLEASAAAAKRAFMCFSPGPWQVSHWTPISTLKPFLMSASATPKAVTWHLTHWSAFCGSAIPFSAANFFACSDASDSNAFECFSVFQCPNWSPASAVLWQLLHLSAPMYLLSAPAGACGARGSVPAPPAASGAPRSASVEAATSALGTKKLQISTVLMVVSGVTGNHSCTVAGAGGRNGSVNPCDMLGGMGPSVNLGSTAGAGAPPQLGRAGAASPRV